MPGVDFSQWPAWLLAVLIVINIFKQQLGALFPDWLRHRLGRQADREEFQQAMHEVLVNSRLQNEATDQLRKSWREEQWAELLQQMLAWLREDLQADLKLLQSGQASLHETTIQVQRNTSRTNDLLTTMNMTLSLLAERGRGRAGSADN
jgi:hypothetical protein